jgi:hypothetical protein
MVLACAQEGHCHEVVVLDDAVDMEGGHDGITAASTLPVNKRAAKASLLVMLLLVTSNVQKRSS